MSSAIEQPPKADHPAIRNEAFDIPPRMKAAVYKAYGPPDVIEIKDVETPVPKDDEVLIQVRAAALNPLDWRIMRGGALPFRILFGLSRPKPRPGVDVAGTVLAIGRAVKQFKPGDHVFGLSKNAVAEYSCAEQSKLALKPDGMTFETAASVPVAGLTALQSLRDHGVGRGTKLLINGAAGGCGTFAIQIAKWLGADVTAVCSTNKVEMVRALGADPAIDYTQEDFTKSGVRYEVILDNVGNVRLSDFKRVLAPDGKVVMAGAPKEPWAIAGRLLQARMMSWFGRQKFHFMVAKATRKDLTHLAELIATKKVAPMVEQCYPMASIREAMTYLETGHVRGKLVIQVS